LNLFEKKLSRRKSSKKKSNEQMNEDIFMINKNIYSTTNDECLYIRT